MMKKIFLIFFLVIFFCNTTNAEECSSCPIKDAPSDLLQKYFENQRSIINRISKHAKWKKERYTVDNIKRIFLRYVNPDLDFLNYVNSLNFLAYEIISNVSPEVTRDKKLIEKELANLQNYFEKNIKNWSLSYFVSSDDLCSWIPNCSLSWTVLDVLSKLTTNNTRILSLYENSILWINTVKEDFIIVEDNFYQEFTKIYNKNTSIDCSMCEWWFYTKAWKRIAKVANNLSWIGNAIKYWEDAWNLLTWNVDKNTLNQLEKDLLSKELARQWYTKSQAEIIISNLEKYQKTWWWLVKNNFILNSINSSISFLTDSVWERYKNVIVWIWDKTIPKIDKSDYVNIYNISKEFTNKDKTWIIYEKMKKQYIELYKDAWNQTVIDEKTINKLILIQTSLSKIIENLNNTVKKSQDVCKKQCQWVWNCENY